MAKEKKGHLLKSDTNIQVESQIDPFPMYPSSTHMPRCDLKSIIICGFMVMMFVWPAPCQGFTERNSLLVYSHRIGQALNVSNCWVCHQLPHESHTGMPFEVVQLDSTEVVKPYRIDNSTGWKWNKLEPSTKGYYRISRTLGPWCWKCNSTGGPRVGTSTCEIQIRVNGAWVNDTWKPNYSLTNLGINGYYNAWTMSSQCEKPWPALKGHYFICGIRAYAILPANWNGNCYVATIFPAMTVRDKLPQGKIRNYRDLEQSKQIIKDYVPMRHWRGHRGLLNAVYRLQAVVEVMANETGEALKALAKEQKEIRNMVLQNRLALDTMLAAQGGVCTLIKQECCVYISDNEEEVRQHAERIGKIAEIPHMSEGWNLWGWLTSWLPNLGGIKEGFMMILSILIVGLILCACLTCVLKFLQNRVKAMLSREKKIMLAHRAYSARPRSMPPSARLVS